jgi:hypothetical protein
VTAPGQVPAGLVTLTEAQWQGQLVELGELFGWHWLHVHPLRTAHGWKTPTGGTLGPGWPDLTLVHERSQRLVLIEVKTNQGHLTPEQKEVHRVLLAAGLDARVWRPRDIDEVIATLTTERAAPGRGDGGSPRPRTPLANDRGVRSNE